MPRRIFIQILLPLLLGAIIYILFRKDTLIHKWLLPADYDPVTADLSRTARLNYFMAFNLPDLCWSYSFASALFISENVLGKTSRLFPLFVLLLLIISEFVQLLFPGNFTFDWMDLAATVCAFGLSYFANRLHDKV
jgi:hypothetical protein